MLKITSAWLICMSICIGISAQSRPNFSNFKGKVYNIPYKMGKKGYGPHVYEYEEIGELDWPQINVPDQENEKPFPDVGKKSLFGMVLYSELTVSEDACYEFILNSDDGSLLWIDKKLVVNNHGDHKMTEVRDTVQIKKGSYTAKIWYNQVYPTRYGFIFDYNYSGPYSSCEKTLKVEVEKQTIVINSSVLFEFDSYQISDSALNEIELVVSKINKQTPKQIRIYGHTDDKGSSGYNLELSQQRADLVMELLKSRLDDGINIVSRGLGETQPIADNSTEEGRLENRRVVIIIE